MINLKSLKHHSRSLYTSLCLSLSRSVHLLPLSPLIFVSQFNLHIDLSIYTSLYPSTCMHLLLSPPPPQFIDLHLSLSLSLSVVNLSSPISLSLHDSSTYLVSISLPSHPSMSLYHIRLRNCLSTEGCVCLH